MDAVGGTVAMTVDSDADCNAVAVVFGCAKATNSSHSILNAANATAQLDVARFYAVLPQFAVHKNG